MAEYSPKRQWIRSRFIVAAFSALMLSSIPQTLASPSLLFAGAAELKKIRAANHERYQRIVFDTSDAVTFSLLKGTQDLTLELKGLSSKERRRTFSEMGKVRGLRVKPITNTSVHIIFDLSGPHAPTYFRVCP